MLKLLQLVVLIGIAYFLWLRWKARPAKEWPTVIGKVMAARIDQRFATPDLAATEVSRNSHEYFQLQLKYQYTVDGTDYVGKKYSVGDDAFVEFDDATAAMKGITPGAEVLVHYDPKNPGNAVLNLEWR